MGKRPSCGVSDACEHPPIDGRVDAEISIRLDTSRLVTALEKWETQDTRRIVALVPQMMPISQRVVPPT